MKAPLSPLALVARGFSAYGSRPAVCGEASWNYAALAERCARLAGAVRAMGVRPGDRVAVLAPNTARALEVYTGVPAAGAVLVPLNTRLSAQEYAYILDHSGARMLILDASCREAVAPALAGRGDLPRLVQGAPAAGEADYEACLAAAPPFPWDPDAVDEDAPISLNYTSGTTGRPKGVVITHRNAAVNVVNVLWATRLGPEDVLAHVAPMFHANGWGFALRVHRRKARNGGRFGAPAGGSGAAAGSPQAAATGGRPGLPGRAWRPSRVWGGKSTRGDGRP